MNNVNLIGRLTRDPELRYTQNGMAVVRFTLAVERRLSKEKKAEAESRNLPTADFISCIAWGKMAETIANYVQKGHKLAVEGRIQTGSYEKEGRKVYTTDIVVANIDFINSSSQNAKPSNSVYNEKSQATNFGNFPGESGEDEGGFFPIDNDNIEF